MRLIALHLLIAHSQRVGGSYPGAWRMTCFAAPNPANLTPNSFTAVQTPNSRPLAARGSSSLLSKLYFGRWCLLLVQLLLEFIQYRKSAHLCGQLTMQLSSFLLAFLFTRACPMFVFFLRCLRRFEDRLRDCVALQTNRRFSSITLCATDHDATVAIPHCKLKRTADIASTTRRGPPYIRVWP